MIEKIENLIKKNEITLLFSMMFIIVVLLLSIFVFFNDSLGWLASNDNVFAQGITVSAQGLPDADVYLKIDEERVEENAADLFSNLMPGQKFYFKFCVKNNSDSKIAFRIAMAAPDPNGNQDTAIVADDLYHYFGTQIRINSIKNGSDNLLTLSGSERYLLPLDDNLYTGGLPPTAINGKYDFSTLKERNLTDEVVVDANSEIFLVVEMEFVDNNTLQNAYMNFGKEEGQTLARTLICDLYYIK